jgi:4-hydroxy-tetrahydrodipicolinate reductase
MPIKVGLFGFGRTGSMVAKEIVADPDMSLEWVCRRNVAPNFSYTSHALGFDDSFAPFVSLDNFNQKFLEKFPVDIMIDFSSNAACTAYSLLTSTGTKIVSAISKYNVEDLDLIKKASEKAAVLSSPNITLGINWMMITSKILKKIIPHADIEIVEEHFRAKHETSGTALKLADQLELDPIKHVNSIRVGGIVGKHEVIFGLPYQTIRLTHESISRSAFGTGAIFAAKWLTQQPAGLYSMEQMFYEKFLNQIKELQF